MDKLKQGGTAIIDFGSQYTQLIARRIRELGVYSEVYTHDGRAAHISQHDPAGYILSGGPDSVYASGSPHLQPFVLETGKPILGICYGMQLLTHAFGGKVASTKQKEYGPATITHAERSPLFDSLPSELEVWMSHGDRIEEPPAGFVALASPAMLLLPRLAICAVVITVFSSTRKSITAHGARTSSPTFSSKFVVASSAGRRRRSSTIRLPASAKKWATRMFC